MTIFKRTRTAVFPKPYTCTGERTGKGSVWASACAGSAGEALVRIAGRRRTDRSDDKVKVRGVEPCYNLCRSRRLMTICVSCFL